MLKNQTEGRFSEKCYNAHLFVFGVLFAGGFLKDLLLDWSGRLLLRIGDMAGESDRASIGESLGREAAGEEVCLLRLEVLAVAEEVLATVGEVLATGGEVLATAGQVLATAEEVLASAGEVLAPGGEVLAAAGVVLASAGEVLATGGEVLAGAGEVLAAAGAERPGVAGASVGDISHVRGSWPTTRKTTFRSILTKARLFVTPESGFMAERFPLAIDAPAISLHSMIMLRLKMAGSLVTRLDTCTRYSLSMGNHQSSSLSRPSLLFIFFSIQLTAAAAALLVMLPFFKISDRGPGRRGKESRSSGSHCF